LTLIQTGKCTPMPVVLIDRKGGDYWSMWQDYVEKQLLDRGLIGKEDLNLYKITDNVEEAVQEVRRFYSNYHSIRYSNDELVIRLKRGPNDKQLAEISEKFSDIKLKGAFRVSGPLPGGGDEPAGRKSVVRGGGRGRRRSV